MAIARRNTFQLYSASEFEDIRFRIIKCSKRKRRGSAKIRRHRFRAHFGADPSIVAFIWAEIASSGWLRWAGRNPDPEHLLWGLLFMRLYNTEEIHASLVGCSEKTFRLWAWFYAEGTGIADLDRKFIRWENRFVGNSGKRCLVTIDGVDFLIKELRPLDPIWYSKKFNKAGLRYEIAICIHTGHYAHYTGPFNCGRWNDLMIFRYKLKGMLSYGEKVVADRGYRGEAKVVCPDDHLNPQHAFLMNRSRARHESCIGRMKAWKILANRWRHSIHKHHIAFRSVIVLDQIKMIRGQPTWTCQDVGDCIV